MKNKLYFAITIALSASIIIFSCKKEEAEADTDTQSSIDYTKSEEAVSTTCSTVNHYGINQEEIKSVTITIDSLGNANTNWWPRKLTVDFGNGVISYDGKTRKGKIIIEFSRNWRPDTIADGTNAIVTFDEFYVNSVQRLGTYTITYDGAPNGGPKYTVNADNAQLVYSNGDVIQWSSTRTNEWIEGYNTTGLLEYSDDVFETTGSVSGINKKGLAYTGNITTPIRIEKGCDFKVTKGIIEITPEEKSTRTIDYGDGECDNEAKLTVNGVSINFVF